VRRVDEHIFTVRLASETGGFHEKPEDIGDGPKAEHTCGPYQQKPAYATQPKATDTVREMHQ